MVTIFGRPQDKNVNFGLLLPYLPNITYSSVQGLLAEQDVNNMKEQQTVILC